MTDVIVEDTASEAETDVKVEDVQETEPETQEEANEVDSSEEGEVEEQPEETVEQRLERLEKERESLEKKNSRQVAAYNRLQEALEKERKERQEALVKADAVDTKQPNIDDFNTLDEYNEAVSDWKAEQKIKAKEAEIAQRQQQENIRKIQEERAKIANEQEVEYLKTNPRYKASKQEFESYIKVANVNPQVEDAIVSMAYKGNVPQLVDYFGDNNGERLDEFEKITQMSPIDAAIEIYKIQQKLVTPKKTENKPLPKPVKASPASKSVKDLSDGSVLKNLGLKK